MTCATLPYLALVDFGAQEMHQDGSHGLQVREVPGGGKMPPVPQDSAMDQVFFALDEISLESFIKC